MGRGGANSGQPAQQPAQQPGFQPMAGVNYNQALGQSQAAPFNPSQFGGAAPQGNIYNQSAQNMGNAAQFATNVGNAAMNPQMVNYQGTGQTAQVQMPGYAQNVQGQGYNAAQANLAGRNAPTMNASMMNAKTNGAAPQLANANIGQYQNPYTQQVTDRTLQGLERQRQMQTNDIGAAASAAGAFGGSRHGVAESLTNEAFARQGADSLAALNSAGFQNAQQAAQYDIGNTINRQDTNQAAINNSRQFNAGNRQQANMANQASQQQRQQMATQNNQFNANNQNAARQFGASAGNTAGLANQNARLQGMNLNNAAQQFNASAQNANNQFNAGNRLQAQGMNQNAMQNAGAMGLNAASTLSGIGNQQFNTGQAIQNQQYQQGQAEQSLQQALMAQSANQFGQYANSPQAALAPLLAALGVPPASQGGTTTQTTTPGLFDFLSLGLGTYGQVMGGRG